MADRIEWFTITVPAGTAISAAITFPCEFSQGDVIEIDVLVPAGPSGLVGFYITAGGSQYVPRTTGQFVKPDDIYFTWPMHNAINSGDWGVVAYNTDIYDHTLQFVFQVNELNDAGVTSPTALGASSAAIPASVIAPAALPPSILDPLSPDFLATTIPANLGLTP